MTQRYTHRVARERMACNLCPECGMPVYAHEGIDAPFWTRAHCSLLPHGVEERIAQYRSDVAR